MVIQISGQHGEIGGGMGGHGGMDSGGMSGMGSSMGGHGGMGSGGMSGMGSGMGGHGGMGSGGMSGMGSCMGGHGGMGGGMGNGMEGGMGNCMGSGMGGECCPMKKVYGSSNGMDGIYTNVGKVPCNKLPYHCNSPCVYERKDSYNGMRYCFADSFTTQAECDASYEDGEDPVDMGSGGMGSGSMGSSGMGCGSMGSGGMGSGSGSGSGSQGPANMESGSGSGLGQGSGSGSGSGQGSGSGAGSGSGNLFCPPKQLMDKCSANCVGASPPDSNFISVESGIGSYVSI